MTRPHRPAHGPRAARGAARATSWLLAAALAAACGRDEAPPHVPWSPVNSAGVVRTSNLEAGPPTADPTARNPYEGDGRALAEGRAAYNNFNCGGCHGGAGGGGIGPPFADREWIYGNAPENVFQSIAQGRPNGMPAFGARVPETTLWKIVAYVQSLGPAATPGPSGGTTGGRQAGGGGQAAGGGR